MYQNVQLFLVGSLSSFTRIIAEKFVFLLYFIERTEFLQVNVFFSFLLT